MWYLYPHNVLLLAQFLKMYDESDWQTKVLTTLSLLDRTVKKQSKF